jgi:hypothetical protein
VWVYMSAMIDKNKAVLLENNLLVLGTIGLRTHLRKSAVEVSVLSWSGEACSNLTGRCRPVSDSANALCGC